MTSPRSSGDRWLGPDETAPVTLTVNGTALEVRVPPRRTLADALRDAGFTSVRLGCEHGEAGEDAKLLAGGQSLLPLLSFRLARPSHIVDIGAVNTRRGVVGTPKCRVCLAAP